MFTRHIQGKVIIDCRHGVRVTASPQQHAQPSVTGSARSISFHNCDSWQPTGSICTSCLAAMYPYILYDGKFCRTSILSHALKHSPGIVSHHNMSTFCNFCEDMPNIAGFGNSCTDMDHLAASVFGGPVIIDGPSRGVARIVRIYSINWNVTALFT